MSLHRGSGGSRNLGSKNYGRIAKGIIEKILRGLARAIKWIVTHYEGW